MNPADPRRFRWQALVTAFRAMGDVPEATTPRAVDAWMLEARAVSGLQLRHRGRVVYLRDAQHEWAALTLAQLADVLETLGPARGSPR